MCLFYHCGRQQHKRDVRPLMLASQSPSSASHRSATPAVLSHRSILLSLPSPQPLNMVTFVPSHVRVKDHPEPPVVSAQSPPSPPRRPHATSGQFPPSPVMLTTTRPEPDSSPALRPPHKWRYLWRSRRTRIILLAQAASLSRRA